MGTRTRLHVRVLLAALTALLLVPAGPAAAGGAKQADFFIGYQNASGGLGLYDAAGVAGVPTWIGKNDVTRAERPDLVAKLLHVSCSDPGLYDPSVPVEKSDLDGHTVVTSGNWIAKYKDGAVSKICGTPPDIAIAKAGPPSVASGGTISYTFTITNTGAGRAYDVRISDRLPAGLVDASSATAGCNVASGLLTCAVGDVGPGASRDVVVTARVTPTACGRIVNEASVSAINEPGFWTGDNASNAVTTTVDCSIDVALVKTNDADRNATFTDDEQAPAAGADVAFHLRVTNTGDYPATITSLTDSIPGTGVLDLLAGAPSITASTCNTLAGVVLAIGASRDCTFTVAGYSPAAGAALVNTAKVVVTNADIDDTATASDTSRVTSPSTPPPPPGPVSIDLVKVNDADGDGTYNDAETAPAQAAAVPFRVTITNTGDVDLTLIELSDAFGDVVIDLFATGVADVTASTCTALAGTTLAAGDSTSCGFTLAGYAPPGGFSLTNIAAVLGVDATGREARADDPSRVDTAPTVGPGTPAIRVIKTNDADGDGTYSDRETAPAPGASVPFRLSITNIGARTLTLTSLVDVFGATTVDLFAAASANTCAGLVGTTLAVLESVTCTFTLSDYAPAAGGSLVNVVTVTGEDEDDTPVRDDDPATVDTRDPNAPDIVIVKTNDANGDGIFNDDERAPAAGADVPFTVTVSNPGAVPVTIVTLVDVVPGIPAPIDVLSLDGCRILAGVVIGPGDEVSCTFVLADYAPLLGERIINTATVTGRGPNGQVVQDSDDSIVSVIDVLPGREDRDPEPGTTPPDPAPQPGSGRLPRTGSDPMQPLTTALALLMVGGTLVRVHRRPTLA